ncbi:MAG: hypothetical protein FJ029_13395 [Actinobacteria bacterium]|nr:hypothetical protein [Actinomycetota bacterium]
MRSKLSPRGRVVLVKAVTKLRDAAASIGYAEADASAALYECWSGIACNTAAAQDEVGAAQEEWAAAYAALREAHGRMLRVIQPFLC